MGGTWCSGDSAYMVSTKKKTSDDALLLTLQQQLQESAEQVRKMQQTQPMTEQEVFGQYVRGALMTMSKRRYKRARKEIGAILESLQESDEEEPPVHSQIQVVPPSQHASWQGTSSFPFQPQPFWSSPTNAWRQWMDKYASGSMSSPHICQQIYDQQVQPHNSLLNMDSGAVNVNDASLSATLGPSGFTELLNSSNVTQSSGLNTPNVPSNVEIV